MGLGELDNTAKQIVARLDDYLPELNTSLMDGRVQDLVLKHPVVRSINVPPADQAARRRCLQIISRVVGAATPVLPLILQDSSPAEQKNGKGGRRNGGLSGTSTAAQVYNNSLHNSKYKPMNVPVFSKETEGRLRNYISELSEREPAIRFWMNHHLEYQQSRAAEAAAASPPAGTTTNNNNNTSMGASPSRKRRMSQNGAGSPATNLSYLPAESTLNLYLKLKISHDILDDLGDRIQGAICMAFWECWDEIYIPLSRIVGDSAMENADQGRLFRVSGDAALYIDNRLAQKKRKISEQQRLSIIAEEDNHFNPSTTSSMGVSTPFGGPTSLFNPLSDNMYNSIVSSTANARGAGVGASQSSGSPALSSTPDSLITDDSKDSNSESSGSSEKLRNASSMHTNNFALIDEAELGFVMDDDFLRLGNDRSHLAQDKNRKEMIDVFTTLHDVGDLLKSRVSSSTSLKSLKGVPHLDLRARIKMMEEGQFSLEEDSSTASSQIVW